MKRRTKNQIAVAICFVLCALHFTDVPVTLVVGIVTWATYQILWRRNKKVLLLTASCVLSLVAFQYLGGMIIRRQISRGYRADVDHRMKPDPAKGINSDGIRSRAEASDFAIDTFNIIVLGDSFVYGEGLKDDNDPMPAQLEALLNQGGRHPPVHVANFAWTSSSPLLSCRLLKDIGAKYKPKLVVLCIDLTDFSDDLEYQLGKEFVGATPIEVLSRLLHVQDEYVTIRERWTLVHCGRNWFGGSEIIPPQRFFVVQQPLAESMPYLRPLERNVREIAEYARGALRARFAAVLMPRCFQYNPKESPRNWEAKEYGDYSAFALEPFKWLGDFKSRVDFPCFSMLEEFKNTTVFPTCFEHDPHWNREGSRVAAEGVAKALVEDGLVPAANVK